MTRMLAVVSFLTLTLAGCGQGGPEEEAAADDPTPTAAGAPLSAVATVYPLAWIAEQVAPDADVTYLAAQGQDPHDLELTAGDRVTFDSADVVLYMGHIDFQPQVERVADGAGGEVVSVADVVGQDRLLEFGAAAAHDDHDDGHDHDSSIDPHVWFDASAMAEVAEAVGEAFAAADPDGAEVYRGNAAGVRDELVALDEELAGLLSDCEFDEVIVSHEAYAYLLEPHGLAQHGISSAGGHSEATPQDIAELTEEVRAEGIPAVLTEPVEGRQDAEAVAAEADVDLIEIYSLDIVDSGQYETGYPQLLREQAQAVAQAARCGP